MEVRTHDNAWQATLNGLLDDIVELNKDKKWELSWQSFYDRFFDDYQDGTHDWLYSAPIEVVRRAAVMYADRAWKTMLWFVEQGYDHIHESEPSAVHDRLVAEGHLPKQSEPSCDLCEAPTTDTHRWAALVGHNGGHEMWVCATCVSINGECKEDNDIACPACNVVPPTDYCANCDVIVSHDSCDDCEQDKEDN